MTARTSSPTEEANRVVEAVLTQVLDGDQLGVVVDSPPGAGKSTLVVRAASELVKAGGDSQSVIVIAQTNEQVDDLIDRLATLSPDCPIGRLSGTDYSPSARILRHSRVIVGTKVGVLDPARVILGTAAKWATVTGGQWPMAIVDEGYQMRSDALLRVAPRFRRALFVGDPGQLDPFSTVESFRWTGLTWDPMQSAMAVLLRHNPSLSVHRLPVSWRLPCSAAPLVSQAFYPFAGFRAGSEPSDRQLVWGASPSGSRRPVAGLDDAIDVAAQTGWALYELPARTTVRTDLEASAACASLAARLLERGLMVRSESCREGRPLAGDRIAIGVAHRDQAAAIRALLPAAARGVTVDTANRLQGREYDVTVVLHPLSGRRDATAFHLEAGRLCVLASRHRQACLVVARAGIPDLLDAHPSTEGLHLNAPVTFPDGWEANQTVLAHLERYRIRALSA